MRVAGIELQVRSTSKPDPTGDEDVVPNQICFPISFSDDDCDLLFTFGLALLSEKSKQSIYDAAIDDSLGLSENGFNVGSCSAATFPQT